MSKEFEKLLGGIRTRQLAKLIAEKVDGDAEQRKRAERILKECGIERKKKKNTKNEDANEDDTQDEDTKNKDTSRMLIYTTREAIDEMATLFKNGADKTDKQLAQDFGKLIAEKTAVPDMALSGRMLETSKSATSKLENTTVEAALQAAHAISTHAARPEVDYYVATDDIPGTDAGAGYVDEAMYASACFYKYFSIDWEQLVKNLKGNEALAAHTVGAFIRGAALTNPTGKQNSFAAHNLPDAILIQLSKGTPTSYANAFAKPVEVGERDIIEQSIAQLAQYVHDLDKGYGKPEKRFWFSPNLRHTLSAENDHENFKSLDDLVPAVIGALGHDWNEVQKAVVQHSVTA
jgi:CRISPR system Cascade subunit CasC